MFLIMTGIFELAWLVSSIAKPKEKLIESRYARLNACCNCKVLIDRFLLT